MRSIKLGILGAGLAVKHLHWPALHELAGMFEIVAVCDRDPLAAAEVGALVGGPDSLGIEVDRQRDQHGLHAAGGEK